MAFRPSSKSALLVFENLAEGVIFTDTGASILAVNSGFTRITGYTAEEVVGRNPRVLQSGVQERDFYEEMWRTLRTTGRWRGEIINRRKSGELYPELLSISAVRNAGGGITNYIGVFSDLSERLAQERAVREMRERLDLALDAGGVGAWSWEPGSGRLECDERACELIAGSQNNPPRTFEALLDRIPVYERPRVMDAFMRPMRQQLAFRAEFRVVLPDGTDRHLVARARPHCGETDGVCRVFGVIWDVTERYLREREIRELNATLERRVPGAHRRPGVRRGRAGILLLLRRARPARAAARPGRLQQDPHRQLRRPARRGRPPPSPAHSRGQPSGSTA